MARSLGIDLGTHVVRLACLEAGQPQPLGIPLPIWRAAGLEDAEHVLPAGVEFDNEKPLQVGGAALSRLDLATRIFSSVRQEAEQALNDAVTGCVVGVASQAGSLHRQILRTASHKAGFHAFRLINRTLAIALSQSSTSNDERRLLVYRMDGTSIDISIAVRSPGSLRELASGGRKELSGALLTRRLFQYLTDVLHLPNAPDDSLWTAAEQAKILLSTREQVSLAELNTGHVPDFTVSRQAFEKLIQPDIQSGIDLCQEILLRAGINSPADLDEIWLAGNSTLIPLIHNMLANWSGSMPRQAGEEAVAFGAAIYTLSLESPKTEESPEAEPPASTIKSPLWFFKPPIQMFEAANKSLPLDEQSAFSEQAITHLQEADRCLAGEDFDGALKSLVAADEHCRKQMAEVHFRRGQAFERAGRAREAQVDYEYALKLDPGHAEARLYKQHQEARNAYQQGRKLEEQKRFSEALQYYQAASRNHPENGEYRNCCALILLVKASRKIFEIKGKHIQKPSHVDGSIKEARKWLQQAGEYQPVSSNVQEGLLSAEKELTALEAQH